MIEDGQKADLLHGVIYMASPDNTDANDLTAWLSTILRAFAEEKGLGKVYLLRVAYRLGKKYGPEPDIGFVPKKLEARRRRGYIAGPPALAIEVVSPDSVARDYLQKRAIYEKAGVREYWILDPDQQRATFLVLRNKRYVEVVPVAHLIRSTVLPGLVLDVRWLLGRTRPSPYQVLQGLLEK
jgi:Uma2 family endonuclease